MREMMFITEVKDEITNKHHIALRNLYLPIIGMESITLYSLLLDYNYMNKNNPSYISIKDIAATSRLSTNEIMLAKSKLEAVGLIRTFEKADNKHFVFRINAPLLPEAFRKNSLLYKNAIKQTGDVVFERVYFSTQEIEIKKDDFKEVSAKYHDVFDIQSTVSTTTLEVPVKFNNKEDAIKGLTASQYVKFLSGAKVSPSQLQLMQRLQNSGLSSHSINEIVDYTFEINGKLVANHVEVIANDMISKGITNPIDIKAELNNAKQQTKPVVQTIQKTTNEQTEELSWNDIFNSLGGEF